MDSLVPFLLVLCFVILPGIVGAVLALTALRADRRSREGR